MGTGVRLWWVGDGRPPRSGEAPSSAADSRRVRWVVWRSMYRYVAVLAVHCFLARRLWPMGRPVAERTR